MKGQVKNNSPLYFEELKINQGQETNIQEVLARFKQFIPANFVSIELQVGNYCGSTNPKWKNKPLCERYGFDYKDNWIQVDIPHTIMEILKLEKGEEINQPLYLDPQVLERNTSYGGITIENEAEIILVNPKKIIIKEAETQTELVSGEITNWEKQLKEKDNKINQLNNQIKELEKERDDFKTELDKEKGWWEKWINDEKAWVNYKKDAKEQVVVASKEMADFLGAKFRNQQNIITAKFGSNSGLNADYYFYFRVEIDHKYRNGNMEEEARGAKKKVKEFKEVFKEICEYYKNK